MRGTRIGLAAVAMWMATAAAQAQVSDNAVKIGVLTDHSGGFAYLVGKHSVEATQMAVDDFGGKVLGKPITVVTADHQNKADIAAALSRKWFETEGVDAITDVAGSAVALATQEIARPRGKVLLISGAATTELTGKACSATTSQWSYDTYAFAKGTASQVTKQGGNSWFFLTSDYAFGHSLQRDASHFVEEAGGKVLGAVRFPFGSPDFSSFLLQAQASKAKVIGLAMSGADLLSAIKQAREFGIVQSGQNVIHVGPEQRGRSVQLSLTVGGHLVQGQALGLGLSILEAGDLGFTDRGEDGIVLVGANADNGGTSVHLPGDVFIVDPVLELIPAQVLSEAFMGKRLHFRLKIAEQSLRGRSIRNERGHERRLV